MNGEEQTIEEARSEDPDYNPIFTTCNVCGRELLLVYEESIGMCQICAGD